MVLFHPGEKFSFSRSALEEGQIAEVLSGDRSIPAGIGLSWRSIFFPLDFSRVR